MIQNCKSEEPHLHAPCLDIFLPIYCNLTSNELESIFKYVFEGVRRTEILESRSERWIIDAYKVLREAECLAQRWLDMKLSDLYSYNLSALSDFALLTYASIVQERDTEETLEGERCVTGWERMIAAYQQILKTTAGTDLIKYNWLYRDMYQYKMVQDEDAYNQLIETMIAFDLTYGLPEHVVDSLSILACEWIRQGRVEESIFMLTRLFETQPVPFFVYERVATMFANLKYQLWLSLLLQGMAQASEQSVHAADALHKIKCIVASDAAPVSSMNNAERRFFQAVCTIQTAPSESIDCVACEILPYLSSIPVKQIPKL